MIFAKWCTAHNLQIWLSFILCWNYGFAFVHDFAWWPVLLWKMYSWYCVYCGCSYVTKCMVGVMIVVKQCRKYFNVMGIITMHIRKLANVYLMLKWLNMFRTRNLRFAGTLYITLKCCYARLYLWLLETTLWLLKILMIWERAQSFVKL